MRKRKSVDPEPSLPEEDLLRPFWYDLPASFYLRVNKSAANFGITRKELVTRAVNNFIAESKKERRQVVLPASPEQEELIKDFQRRAGALRWKNVGAEERRELMRKMAMARWGSKKTGGRPEKPIKKSNKRSKP